MEDLVGQSGPTSADLNSVLWRGADEAYSAVVEVALKKYSTASRS